MKKLKLRHNTLMRLNTAVALLLAVPGLLFLLSWIFVEARWAWIAPAVWEAAMLYGIAFGWRHIVVRRATCSSSLLPESFDGYRVLQFSDLHIGTFYRNPGFIRKLVNMINAERPDMIVFTGDMVNVSASEVIPFMKDLAKSRHPTVSSPSWATTTTANTEKTRASITSRKIRTYSVILKRNSAGNC